MSNLVLNICEYTCVLFRCLIEAVRCTWKLGKLRATKWKHICGRALVVAAEYFDSRVDTLNICVSMKLIAK